MTLLLPINDTIIQFYKNLFNETIRWHPKLDGFGVSFFIFYISELAEKTVQEEVLYVLLSMDGDKGLGPDGFTIAFFQSC
jgi:hypothetical protein